MGEKTARARDITVDGKPVLYPEWGEDVVQKYKNRWRIQRGNRSEQLGDAFIEYAVVSKPGKPGSVLFLHRLLYPHLPLVEHIDGDGLNNLEWNVRRARGRRNMYAPTRNLQWKEESKSFYLRMVVRGKRRTRYFGVRKWGSKKKALEAATRTREEWKTEINEI